MCSSNQRWLSISIVLIACLTRTVDAQPVWQPVGSGDEGLKWSLNGTDGPSLKVGEEILVVEDGEKPLKVRIVAIQPDGLVVSDKGQPRHIPVTRVGRIQRGDGLANGALVGFLAGAGLALNRLGSCEINCYVAFVPVLGGIGAGVGTLIDATKRRTTLYIEPD